MYNDAHHKNIGVLGRYVEGARIWEGGLFCPQHTWKFAENILHCIIIFWPMHAIDITIPDGSIIKKLESNL